jgi:hypothetical protein
MCNGHLFHKWSKWSLPKEKQMIQSIYDPPLLGGQLRSECPITVYVQERYCNRCGKYQQRLEK